jgi:hypothetical protein
MGKGLDRKRSNRMPTAGLVQLGGRMKQSGTVLDTDIQRELDDEGKIMDVKIPDQIGKNHNAIGSKNKRRKKDADGPIKSNDDGENVMDDGDESGKDGDDDTVTEVGSNEDQDDKDGDKNGDNDGDESVEYYDALASEVGSNEDQDDDSDTDGGADSPGDEDDADSPRDEDDDDSRGDEDDDDSRGDEDDDDSRGDEDDDDSRGDEDDDSESEGVESGKDEEDSEEEEDICGSLDAHQDIDWKNYIYNNNKEPNNNCCRDHFGNRTSCNCLWSHRQVTEWVEALKITINQLKDIANNTKKGDTRNAMKCRNPAMNLKITGKILATDEETARKLKSRSQIEVKQKEMEDFRERARADPENKKLGKKLKAAEALVRVAKKELKKQKVNERVVDFLMARAYVVCQRDDENNKGNSSRLKKKVMFFMRGKPEKMHLCIGTTYHNEMICQHSLERVVDCLFDQEVTNNKHLVMLQKEAFAASIIWSVGKMDADFLTSLKSELLYCVIETKKRTPNVAAVDWDSVRKSIPKDSALFLYRHLDKMFDMWKLHYFLVAYPGYIKRRSCYDFDFQDVLKATAGGCYQVPSNLLKFFEEFAPDLKITKKDTQIRGVAYKKGLNSSDVRLQISENQWFGEKTSEYVKRKEWDDLLDFMGSAVFNTVQDHTANNNGPVQMWFAKKECGGIQGMKEGKWSGKSHNFSVGLGPLKTPESNTQDPHYDWFIKDQPCYDEAALQERADSTTSRRVARKGSKNAWTVRDVSYTIHFPVTKSGMFLHVWIDESKLDESKGTMERPKGEEDEVPFEQLFRKKALTDDFVTESICLFIPFGGMLILNGNTMHAGGMGTDYYGNLRMHGYAYNASDLLIHEYGNDYNVPVHYVHNEMLNMEWRTVNNRKVHLEYNFFGNQTEKHIRDGYDETSNTTERRDASLTRSYESEEEEMANFNFSDKFFD